MTSKSSATATAKRSGRPRLVRRLDLLALALGGIVTWGVRAERPWSRPSPAPRGAAVPLWYQGPRGTVLMGPGANGPTDRALVPVDVDRIDPRM